MKTHFARFRCGLCLTAMLTSQSLPAQEPVQNPAQPNTLQPAPDEIPKSGLVLPQSEDGATETFKPTIYPAVTSSSLQERLELPKTILDSKIYPELVGELDQQLQEDLGFRASEAPANWHAIGNPFATIQVPLEPLTHNPLYFEEPLAERYGYVYSDCVQPFASAAHFYLRVPLLSVRMLITPPRSLVTPYWPQVVDPAFEYDK